MHKSSPPQTLKNRLNRRRLIPRSLVSRMLWLTLLSVFVAQLIATSILYSQSKYQGQEGLRSVSVGMANSFASTVTFFQSLPAEYRHIVLDQQRNMGGTRFFVSFNKEEILIEPIEPNEMRRTAINVFRRVLQNKLPQLKQLKIEFSHAENLHVLRNDILLKDLPKSWAHYTLSLEPLNPPILVVQFELAPNEWLYIAALLPSPYMMLEDQVIPTQQIIFIGFITALLLMFTFMMVRRQVKPLKRLAHAANALSMDIDQPPLTEEGAFELVTATRAFNRMQIRLRRHMEDRAQLFSAISHDLKTPITRLRLRAGLIRDEAKLAKFNRDLDELELMVKGALQAVKDTDIHENLDEVEPMELLTNIAEPHNLKQTHVIIHQAKPAPLICKPLALKRCISNLIDNGVRYGERVTVTVEDSADTLRITLDDQGPGIPPEQIEEVFKPHFRIAKDQQGHGLGMGIAKNIIHAHGGNLNLQNLPEGGLRVVITLPRVTDLY